MGLESRQLKGNIPENKLSVAVQDKLNTTGSGDLTSTNNLNDVENIGAARTNLDVYSKSESDALVSSGNPSIITAATVGEITAAGVGAIVEIQETITLTADYTPPAGQTWWFSSGKIDLDIFKITGVETHVIPRGDRLALDCFSGELDGTWKISSDIFSKMSFSEKLS